ncbi:MAG: oligosaccharide flippase family protein [Clostridia bacterium]|nr:oligosaccharide flippase family protein [Clostridia bacterium]
MILSCASIILRGLSVSFNIYLTAKIGAEGMGLITLIGSIYGLFITFATSGINLAVTRLVSSCYSEDAIGKADKKTYTSLGITVKSGFIYALIFSLTASAVLYVSAPNIGAKILGDRRTVASLKLLSVTLTPIAITSAINGYFNGVRRVYKSVTVQICEQLVKMGLCAVFLALILPKSVESACYIIILSGALSELLSLILSVVLYLTDRQNHVKKEDTSLKIRDIYDSDKKKDGFSTVFSLAFPVAVSAYVRAALSTVEHIAIPWGLRKSGIGASSSLASYGILHGMVFPLLFFPSAVLSSFSSLLIPELTSSQSKGNNKSINRIVSSVISLSLLFSIGVSGVLISFSYEIGSFLYGSAEAGEYIRILSPLIPLMYLDGTVDSMLKGLGEQLYSMRVNIADSLLSVILIVTLLPTYGIRGYVAVIFITELFNASLSIIRLLNVTNIDTPLAKWILKPLFSVLFATVVTRFIFNNSILPFSAGRTLLITEIVLSSIIYIGTAFLFGKIKLKR